VSEKKATDLDLCPFVIDRLLLKLFKTNNMETVRQYQQFFQLELSSATVTNRAAKFDSFLMQVVAILRAIVKSIMFAS